MDRWRHPSRQYSNQDTTCPRGIGTVPANCQRNRYINQERGSTSNRQVCVLPQTSKEGSTALALKPAQAKALDGPCECFLRTKPNLESSSSATHTNTTKPAHSPTGGGIHTLIFCTTGLFITAGLVEAGLGCCMVTTT